MSRLPLSAMLALAVLPALTGCSSTHSTDVGLTLTVAHPQGDFEQGPSLFKTSDVTYMVRYLSRTEPDRVDFDLIILVPEFGRPFGFGDLAVTCVADGATSTADTDEELRSEEFGGVFEFPMWCEAPEDAERMVVEIDHHDEQLSFEGAVF
ncbi:hypothetical protein [Nocardiopsis sp. MG754419]|uniref:hypothetical protein n=1 Tax=Nocardiopsis sp. MG754419 TaxID=2259865 RepID=UPI001BAB1E88|nr:hypothetical protein [Nocardiopsis sp. MG754419]MBR8741239.1 hypothetical protein [Nocardiopsis sp. MG754419]